MVEKILFFVLDSNVFCTFFFGGLVGVPLLLLQPLDVDVAVAAVAVSLSLTHSFAFSLVA